MKAKHNEYMRLALQLAKKALGKTSPNPMVGAVVVKNNRIIAKGYHKKAGLAHAEVEALNQAKTKARGATLYVTLEPCYHEGRTPPCVDAVIKSGIKSVYIAVKDPNPKTRGKSISKLKKHKIKVYVGFLEQEAIDLNEIFFKYQKKNLPFCAIKSAQTLDGKIATRNDESKWITSKATREYAYKVRDQFDAILVGINTVIKDNPKLKGFRKNKEIKRIVCDSKLRISLNANVLKGKDGLCIIATTVDASDRKKAMLEKKGIFVLTCPKKRDQVDLKWLMKQLAKWNITSVLIEGGAEIIGSALKAQIVDKAYVYIATKIIGDQQAKSSITGLNTRSINKSLNLYHSKIDRINEDILVSGYVYRNN